VPALAHAGNDDASLAVKQQVKGAVEIVGHWPSQAIGQRAGKRITCVLTDMNAPIGRTIGNALEIRESIEILRGEGLAVTGPLPADTMFHEAARKTYDCAICMYHDQALIPVKTLAFDDAVNVTLGLPFIRTSPDHGTAFDIAGTGRANPSSLIAALRLAARMAATQPA